MDRHVVHDYIAGGIGGAAALVVGHPFDTVKVQLQTQDYAHKYKSLLDAVTNINQTGWIRGFFRGLSFPLCTFGIVNSLLLGVYGSTMKILEPTPPQSSAAHYWNVYLAGCAGGLAFQPVAIPFDYIKVVLQSQIKHELKGEMQDTTKFFRGPIECMAQTYKIIGIRGLFKGGAVMAVRDVPTCGLYMLIYSYLNDTLRDRGWTDRHGIFSELFSGGTAGSVAWFATFPLDVIKSRYQADIKGSYKTPLEIAIKCYKQEGIGGFYKGCFVTCLRAFPSCAVCMLVYSNVLQFLGENPIK